MIITQKMSDECFNKREYYAPCDIAELLNSIGCIEEKRESSKHKEEARYTFVATYSNGITQEIKGNYNRLEMPLNWDYIVDTINSFISFYSTGELLDKYNIPLKLAKDEVIYASVCFSESSGTYYYLVENMNVAVGDIVTVPVGSNNVETKACIVDLAVYKVSEVPFPLDKIKKNLR